MSFRQYEVKQESNEFTKEELKELDRIKNRRAASRPRRNSENIYEITVQGINSGQETIQEVKLQNTKLVKESDKYKKQVKEPIVNKRLQSLKNKCNLTLTEFSF